MASPITWQNVNGPSLADAAAPMLAAQRSFDNAFGRVREDLTKREATADANNIVIKGNNTDAALSAIRKYKTPEELAQAQSSGQIDSLMSNFNGQVDRRVVDQAMDLRPGVLRERVQGENRFADDTLQRQQRPLVDEFQNAVASGDTVKAQKLLDQHEYFNEGQYAKYLSDATRARTVAGQQDEAAAHAAALRPGQLALQEAQTRNVAADAAEKEGSNTGAGIVGTAHRSFMQQGTDRTNALMKLATDLKLPVNKAGFPDDVNMDGQQIVAFEKALKERGLDTPVQNSTTAANAARERLQQAGLNPKQFIEASKQIDTMFAKPALSPEDAAKLKGLTDTFDATNKTRQENNPFYSTGKERVEQETAVYNDIRTKIKDSEGTKDSLIEEARKLMTEGIEINGMKRPVPPKLLQSIMVQTLESDEWMFGVNETISHAEPLIKAYMESPAGAQMFMDAQEYKSGNDKVRRKELVDTFNAGTNTANPNSYLEGVLKRREKTASQKTQ